MTLVLLLFKINIFLHHPITMKTVRVLFGPAKETIAPHFGAMYTTGKPLFAEPYMYNAAGIPVQKKSNLTMLNEVINHPTAVWVDVRSEWEFEGEHLPNAKNIPLEYVPLKLSEIRDLPRPILLYCRSGSRSGMAATMLKQAGVDQVYNVGSISQLKRLLKNQ
jgi:phage shock protein E